MTSALQPDPAHPPGRAGAQRRVASPLHRQCCVRATGVTHSMIRQIERARYAALLLKSGVSIPDATQEAGYFDQPHLTRSMKHFIGQRPAELLDEERSDQLSFLYKTRPFVGR